jgi:hypothetical protein
LVYQLAEDPRLSQPHGRDHGAFHSSWH